MYRNIKDSGRPGNVPIWERFWTLSRYRTNSRQIPEFFSQNVGAVKQQNIEINKQQKREKIR